ncbi:MFS transporter [Lysinibacillus sp. BW-2-10]|uniref:MFS transporter n=1 Tax=Lysinibacillus sp. BW-2-10 TaxID=2590030 RepID=UPI00117C5F34|nr:MFS transporter [Lysinibacillus sp. BW-2-10]TSI06464.1 MFS transporter [Lysinibacillus sp. BW-2-10]
MKYFIYAIIFFSFFDLFTQLPIMSTFAESIGTSSFVTGLAVGMYSFSNTFGNIISGIWTDRKGPFIILIIGLLTTGLSLFSYGLINDTLSLLVVRFLHGLVAGLIVPAAFTYLSNLVNKEERGKGSAISGAFVGIAAITGPAFSGILASRTSVPFVFSITAIFMLLLGVIAIFVLSKFPTNTNRKVKQHNPTSKISDLLLHTGVIKALTGAFFLMFSQGVIAYLLPLHVEALSYDAKVSGTLLSTFGVVAVLVFLLPTNRIFDRVTPIYTLSLGIALMGGSQLLLSIANDIALLYVAMATYGIGFGFLFPSINSLLIDSTTKATRGKAYGYFYAFFSLGVVVGSSILGWLSLSISHGFLLTGVILLFFALITLIKKTKSTTR